MIPKVRIQQALSLGLIVVLSLTPQPSRAWSIEGHQTIALIASNQLQGTVTATRIKSILGKWTLTDIAICPDQVREITTHEIKKMSAACTAIFPDPPVGTQNGHFVNLPVKSTSYIPTQTDIDAVCADQCVTVEIYKYLKVLADAKPGDSGDNQLSEQQALSFVVHFVGDIHQPLHTAERNDDSGGNNERVSFYGTDVYGNNYPLKLHTIWDNQIVSRIDATYTKLAADLQPEIAKASAEPTKSDPTAWAIQSFQYAESVAYKGIPAPDGNRDVAMLGDDYQNTATPIVRIQIARAGVRLAAVLKSALH